MHCRWPSFLQGAGALVADAVIIRRGVLRDNEDKETKVVGKWRESSYATGAFAGRHYLVKEDTEKSPGWEEFSVTYSLKVPDSGIYSLFASTHGIGGRAASVPVTVKHSGGTSVVEVDQRTSVPIMRFLGAFQLSPEEGEVSIGVKGTAGKFVLADFVWATKHAIVDVEHGDHVDIGGSWRTSSSRAGFTGTHYLVEESDSQSASVT